MPAPLDKKALLADSRQFRGVSGILSFAVVRALRQSGAPAEAVKAALDAMVAHLPGLSKEDAAVLGEVVRERLGEETGA